MWFDLNSTPQFRFEGILNPVPFFDHVSILLAPSDTLVLGCYEPLSQVRDFARNTARPDAILRYVKELRANFDGNRHSYPGGAAFHLPATQDVLEKLAGFARSDSPPYDFCDHVAAYSRERPIFIFHDAFFGGALYLSLQLSRDRIERFSEAIGIPFEIVEEDWMRLS
jgi:hypothetical protein